jgi:D-glycero-D-manno-heptose 1,7-bisphosphate phosphatase
MGRPAIFLDRDGVINENLPDHVRSWADFRFLPGVLDALRALTTLGVPLFVVTNQAVIGRRLISTARLEGIHRRMLEQIRLTGGAVTEVLYCPHEPHAGCLCRKPQPGMLLTAAERFDIDLTRSVFIGDAASDLLAGQRVGCRTILVQTGRGRGALRDLAAGLAVWPTAVVRDLPSAVATISHLIASTTILPDLSPNLPLETVAQATHENQAVHLMAVHAAD